MTTHLGLHTHWIDTWEEGRFRLDRVSRSPEVILDRMKEIGLTGIALTDFTDKRFWKFEDACPAEGGKVGKYSVVKKLENAIIFSDDSSELQVYRGYEVEAKEGHIFCFGLNRDVVLPYGLPLVELLKKGKALNAVMWPDHPFGAFGIGKQRIIDNAKYFSAFEGENCNYSTKWSDIIEVKVNTELPSLAVDDAHNPRDMGNGYIMAKSRLYIKNEEDVRELMRDTLKQHFVPVTIKKNSLFSKLRHVATVQYDCRIRRPLGFLPQP